MKDMSEAKFLGLALQRRSGVGVDVEAACNQRADGGNASGSRRHTITIKLRRPTAAQSRRASLTVASVSLARYGEHSRLM